MPDHSYKTEAVVLRRIKLKENDLIVVLLDEKGGMRRLVARGARKPTSSFSSRLEPFSVVEVFCAQGKGDLDILKEARLIASHEGIRGDMQSLSIASPMLEILDKLAQADEDNPKLYAMTLAALQRFDELAADAASAEGKAHELATRRMLAVAVGHLLKAFSYSGFRPSFGQCASCGQVMDIPALGVVPFSYAEGGCICDDCRLSASGVVNVESHIIRWADYLLHATFDDICKQDPSRTCMMEIAELCQSWSKEHAGVRLKSLQFLFTYTSAFDPIFNRD